MSFLDARLSAAMMDVSRAQGLLMELHQQILTCQDGRVLSELLGKYGATAVARLTLMTDSKTLRVASLSKQSTATVQMESRKAQTLSNISKAYHDIAMSSINNMKA